LKLIALRGNTHPEAQARYDTGTVPPATRADRLILVLSRSEQQEASLRSYLASVQDGNSPQYRQFLTPEQFGKLYGIGDGDLQTIQTWLTGHGLSVDKVAKGRTYLEFSGTVGQVQDTFHTSIHRYRVNGVDHLANASDPEIPEALAQVVVGVSSLNDFRPRPLAILGPKGKWKPDLHRFDPVLTAGVNNQSYLFVGPGDAATIYDAPDSLNSHLAAGQSQIDGTGVTIGVVGDSAVDFSGVDFYRSLFGLPNVNPFNYVVEGDQSNLEYNGDEIEALLDSEVSGGLAPGAHVILYVAGNTLLEPGLFLAIDRAIDDNDVGILSVSFSGCETDQGVAGNLQILNMWEQAAAQGIAVVVSTGDSGSAGCDDPDSQTVAKRGFAVNALASTPYDVAVGGTDFDALSANFAKYVNSTNSANFTSAISYIPENPWNDSTSDNGLVSANAPYKDGSGNTNIIAGGGGASSAGTTNASGARTGYPKPAWQQGFAASDKDSVRDLPDVSLLAGNGQYQALWAICTSSDCDAGPASTISGVGGTSASAPAFAGILALVNQKIGASTRLGQPNWVLYKLAQIHPAVFHSIATGNNSVYCTAGSPDCGTNQFLTGYDTATTYSQATGLGSVDIMSLVDNWSSVALTPTKTTLTLDKTNFVHGANVNIAAQVNPGAAMGSVAIVNNANAQAQATGSSPATRLSLSDGSAAGSYAGFPGGTYDVYADYPGDGSYAASVSQPVQVTVLPENSIVLLQANTLNSSRQPVSAAKRSFPLGTAISIDAQPVGASGGSNAPTNATGTVSFTDSFAGGQLSNAATITLASGNAEWNFPNWQAGAHSISAQYSGDLSYNAGVSNTPVTFTIDKAPTAISLSAAASTVTYGSLTINGQVTANIANSSYPIGGTVIVTDTTNGAVLLTEELSGGGGCTATTPFCAPIFVSVPVGQFALGANSIVASYSGDANFGPSGPTKPVIVTCTANCSSGTGQTIELSFYGAFGGSISAGGSLSATVSVSPGGGFTGAVNLTCSVSTALSNPVDLPTCAFDPVKISIVNTQAVSSALTIKTTAPTTTSMIRRPPGPAPKSLYLAAGTCLATVFLFAIPGRRRSWRKFFAATILLASIAGVSSCGGGSSSGGGTKGGGQTIPGTSSGVYTITFHAADTKTGTVTAQDYFNITVN